MHIRLQTTDSTNSHLHRLLAEGQSLPEMTIVSTVEQTAGRGQKGNSWESEPGKNAIFSILLHPTHIPAMGQFILSQAIALAIAETLSGHTDSISIKWPNDIYWHDKKISGTLIECDLRGKNISNCIIGCGININQTLFVSDAPNPVSLKQITGKDHDTASIISEVADRLLNIYNNVSADDIRAAYMQRLYRNDGSLYPYEDDNGTFQARICGIEPTGHLLLQTHDGEMRRYEFKEVRFVNLQH
jgi:BirA family biotin operon repressor/biotin-[acetyl-CoA-carboxylase] ligase